MITLAKEFDLYLNFIVLTIVAIQVFYGYHKGALYTILSFVETLICYFIAWHFSGIFAKHFILFTPTNMQSIQPGLDSIIQLYFNQVLWFCILFFALKIVCVILNTLVKGIHHLPFIGSIDAILGAVVGLVLGAIWCVILSILLTTPLFDGGVRATNTTLLKPINQIVGFVANQLIEPIQNANTLDHLQKQLNDLTDQQKQALDAWLDSQDVEKQIEGLKGL